MTTFCEFAVLTPRPGRLQAALERLETVVSGPALLGCWTSILGHEPRIFVLSRSAATSDHEAARRQAIGNQGLLSLADLLQTVTVDTFATLPCLPGVQTGACGSIFEFRIYELQPMGALQAACTGWADVLPVRLPLAPINAVMHSVTGQVPRLIHIYAYRDMQHRIEIREQAIATGLWPPKGGADRNQVMAAEIAVPAPFSPTH